MHDVWRHPLWEARKRWVNVDSPAGSLPALLPPGRSSAFHPRMSAVPGLGEHSDAILEQLGYDHERIAAFKTAGVI